MGAAGPDVAAKVPTMTARVDELIVIVAGLRLEIEGARKQTSYISDIVSDLLRSVMALRNDPRLRAVSH